MRDTIDMAREAGFFQDNGDGQGVWLANTSSLKAFEALVRADAIADEREACAKLCQQIVANATDWDSSYWDSACMNCSAAIRARGNT
jgi:hypothetical protein